MAGGLASFFAAKEEEYGLPAGYLLRTAEIESRLNPMARNPRSSAGGLFQFIDSTAADYGLENKFDAAASTDAAARLAADNAKRLRSTLGREPTAAELYLSHQQGGGGAAKLLANPNAPAASLVGQRAVQLNGGDPTMTAADFATKWTGKFDGKVSEGTMGERARRADMPVEGAMETTGGLGGLGGFRVPPAPQNGGGGGVDTGALFRALSAGLLSGNRDQFMGPGFTQQIQAEMTGAQRRQEHLYGREKDDRDFGLRERQLTASEAARLRDDKRADEQLSLSRSTAESTKLGESGRAMQLLYPDLKPGTPEYRQRYNEVSLGGSSSVTAQLSQRKAAAESVGLRPDSPGYQSFLLTGRMPREDQQPLSATDKKAIMEADEGVLSGKNAVAAFDEAKRLSKQAYEGPLADKRGYVTSLFGNKEGEATTQLNNVVMSNALGSLKSIFGAAPTEGERKILLEIQGSASQPDSVRQDIYNRAQELAKRRLEYNAKLANELRGGTYYKPDGSKGTQTAAPDGNGAPLETETNPLLAEARSAISRGAPRDKVIERLRQRGIDPSGL